MANLTTAERMLRLEDKVENNGKRITRLEQKVDKTHDAVLQLPQELRKHFATLDQHLEVRKDVEDLKNDRKWITRLVVATVIMAIMGLVISIGEL